MTSKKTKASENLIPNSKRTPAELREITKKGGKKSGEARREKKTMRETLEFILSSNKIPSGNKAISGIKSAMLAFGYTEEQIDMKTLFGFSMYINAVSGKSPKYSELILGIIGEAPSDKVELTGANGTPLMPVEIITNFVQNAEADDNR